MMTISIGIAQTGILTVNQRYICCNQWSAGTANLQDFCEHPAAQCVPTKYPTYRKVLVSPTRYKEEHGSCLSLRQPISHRPLQNVQTAMKFSLTTVILAIMLFSGAFAYPAKRKPLLYFHRYC